MDKKVQVTAKLFLKIAFPERLFKVEGTETLLNNYVILT